MTGAAAADELAVEAERLSLDDPLLECLAFLAGEYGRRITAVALASGLPIPTHGLVTPAVFVRAAERAGLTAKMVRRPLSYLADAPNLPCILLLHGDQACILRRRKGADSVELLFPETPDAPVEMKISELEKRYAGYAFFIRPRARLDERSGIKRRKDGTRHWFWSAIRQHKKIYYEVMLAAVMINIFALASPLFIMNVYDRVIPNNAFESLWVLAAGVAIVFIFDFLLKNLRAFFLDAAGRKADNTISARIFEQMLGMKMAGRPPSAGALASNMREFETIRDFFTSATVVTLIDLPFIFLFLLLIFMIGGNVVLVPALLVPIVLVIGWLLQKPLNRVIEKSMQEGGHKSSLIFETLSGLETIKVQAAEGYIQRKWEEIAELASETNMEARRIAAFGVNFAAFAAHLSTVGIVVYGTYLISAGEMSIGALIACVILSGRVMAPLGQVAGLLTKLGQSKEALARLEELMAVPVERPEKQVFISRPVIQGHIAFKDVTFRYPGQTTPALRNVSFEIAPGDHIGVIGAVGSGKTTLERLILNLYQPESGSVQIDGTDVRQIDPADLRRNIGVVQQFPYLFYGTVRENITLGHETVPDSVVLRAAEMAGVMSFLRESEAGLDSQVGERGELLSGGQRQAIAIARALLYDPPVILMDEPTASIDPGSERRLYRHLVEVCKDKTVMLITHKSSVLGLVDKLVLMDRGRVIAIGPRDEIIHKLQTGEFLRPAGGEKKE
ncbi:MAG: type I secretion system permease/ATPase [Micavibrio sp.]|nr:MAG: type I secretion system permease/ATPase [Micavibrio sp.]